MLRAEATQAEVPTVRVPKGEVNQPQCPIYRGCNQVGVRPRDEAVADAEAEKASSLLRRVEVSTGAGRQARGGGSYPAKVSTSKAERWS